MSCRAFLWYVEIIPNDLDVLAITTLMCLFHSKSDDIITPTNLVSYCLSNFEF